MNLFVDCILFFLVLLTLAEFNWGTSDSNPKDTRDDISAGQMKNMDMMIEQASNHSKQGLGKLFDRIDTNDDKFVVKEELIDWIILYNEELIMKEAAEDMKRFDSNNDSQLSWDEFMKWHYANISMENPTANPDDKDIFNFIKDDKLRFVIADADKDEQLSLEELKAFLHPHSYVEMLDYEVHRALASYDKNDDKRINRIEFIETQYGTRKISISQKTYINKVFDNYDTDNDEQLSESEIKLWLTPDIMQFAKTESHYLIKVSDANDDQKLSKEEVVDNFGHWVSSKATNFGTNLRDEL